MTPFHVRSSIWNYVNILGVNKHATNDAVRGELGRFPLLFQIMQRSFNFYSRAISLGENHLMKHACNSNGSWVSLLDKIIEKYQISAEHHTSGSPTDSAPILNNMMNIYESLWYQNITRSADNKLRTYSSIKTKFCLEPYIIPPLDKEYVNIVIWTKLKTNITWFLFAHSTLTKGNLYSKI